MPLIALPDEEVSFEDGKVRIRNMVVECNCDIEESSVRRKIFNLTPGFSAVPLKILSAGKCGEIKIKF